MAIAIAYGVGAGVCLLTPCKALAATMGILGDLPTTEKGSSAQEGSLDLAAKSAAISVPLWA